MPKKSFCIRSGGRFKVIADKLPFHVPIDNDRSIADLKRLCQQEFGVEATVHDYDHWVFNSQSRWDWSSNVFNPSVKGCYWFHFTNEADACFFKLASAEL